MLATFAPPARQTVIRAGPAGREGGATRRATATSSWRSPKASPSPARWTSASPPRRSSPSSGPRRHDGTTATCWPPSASTSTRCAAARLDATSARLDDPARWRLRRSRLRPLRVTLTGPAAEITLNEGGRKAIEVARWASRRGHRTQIAREDLLWGLLADASSESVRILRRGQVDLGRLWADLRRWHQSA